MNGEGHVEVIIMRAPHPPVKREPHLYVVIHEDTVVERIRAHYADEAFAKQTQPGTLFLRVGG